MLIGTLHVSLHVTLFWSKQLLKTNQNKKTSCGRTTGCQKDRKKQRSTKIPKNDRMTRAMPSPLRNSDSRLMAPWADEVITHMYKVFFVPSMFIRFPCRGSHLTIWIYLYHMDCSNSTSLQWFFCIQKKRSKHSSWQVDFGSYLDPTKEPKYIVISPPLRKICTQIVTT